MVTEMEKLAVLCQQLQMGARAPAQGKTATFQKVRVLQERMASDGGCFPHPAQEQRASGMKWVPPPPHPPTLSFTSSATANRFDQNRSAAAAESPSSATRSQNHHSEDLPLPLIECLRS